MNAQISVQRLIVALGAMVAIGPFAIDTYIPGVPSMARDFDVLTSDVERSISLYLLGAAVGQLFAGPLSDRYGRKRIAYIGLALFSLTSAAIALINSVLLLDLMRVVQALGGGVTVITTGATVRDHFQGRAAARMITAIGMVMLVAPLIAPAVGRGLITLGGWRLIFVSLALYGVLLVWVVRYVLPDPAPNALAASHDGLITRWKRVLSFGPGRYLIIANGFSFAVIFAFITDSAFLYLEFYQVGDNLFPVYFGANVVAMLLFNRLNVRLLRRFEAPAIMGIGVLILLGVALLLLLQFMLWDKPSLWTVVPNIMLLGGLVALVMPNGIASLLQLFPRDAGTASGLNGSGQFMLSGVLGVTLVSFHDGTPMPMAIAMVIAASLAAFGRYKAGRGHDLTQVAPGQALPDDVLEQR